MAFSAIPGSRHGSTLFTSNDGFYYRYISVTCNKTDYECYKGTCSARVWSELGSNTFVVNNNFPQHNHEPELIQKSVWELRENIIKRVVAESIAPRKIFDEECQRVDGEVAAHLAYGKMESSLQKFRRKCFPRLPKSAVEFGDMISSEDWNQRFGQTLNGKPFFRRNIIVDDNSNLVFISENLKDLLKTTKEIHLDGTFKVVPKVKNLKQLFVVMAVAHDHAFPVCFVLMERRTTAAYTAVLEYIKSLVPEINPDIVMSDYEGGIMASVNAVFPNTTIAGCWWHFANRILKKVKHLRLLAFVRRNMDIKKVMLMCMALPLLPSQKMQEGLDSVKNHSTGLEMAARTRQALQTLFNYIQRQWLNRVGAQKVSVNGLPRRTNNDSESFNMSLQREMGQNHPEAWKFIDHLKHMESISATNLARAQDGLPFTRQCKKRKFLLKDSTLKSAAKNLEDERITVLEFLTSTSGVLGRQIVIPDPDTVDIEEEEDDDVEDEAGPPSPERPEDEAPEQEMMELENYRLTPTPITIRSWRDCPPQAFVTRQISELQACLTVREPEEALEEGSPLPKCVLCSTNRATRANFPCGHWQGCITCTVRAVETPIYFQIVEDIDLPNVRLPLRCHQCNSLVGKLMRVF